MLYGGLAAPFMSRKRLDCLPSPTSTPTKATRNESTSQVNPENTFNRISAFVGNGSPAAGPTEIFVSGVFIADCSTWIQALRVAGSLSSTSSATAKVENCLPV